MRLPVMPPVKPMLAKSAKELPPAGGVLYEPKWDGFRCIVFRDGDEVELGSRNEKPLTRYFPDVVQAVVAQLPQRCVVDGEIVIAGDAGLDFDALQMRIHPAASRVKTLAETSPASLVGFDLLALGDDDLRGHPLRERRARMIAALGHVEPPVHLTPATEDRDVALDWFSRFEGAGLDGVVAKSLTGTYQEDKRVMTKIKHERTADCVVAGYRWHKSGAIVGSLLLGLYDEAGVLHHLGVTASFTMARRVELVAELAPHVVPEGDVGAYGFDGRGPGGPNRWNAGADRSFVPLKLELVCEVAYDHLQGERFRHATTFRRWRPDKSPGQCTYAQLETATPEDLSVVFGAGR